MTFKESSQYTLNSVITLTCTYVEDNTVWLHTLSGETYKLDRQTNKLYVYNQSCNSYDTVEPSVASTLKEKAASYSAKDVNVYLGDMQIDGWYGD